MKLLSICTLLFFALVFTSCEKQVSTSPPEPDVPLGFVAVDSNPRGAQIFVDGRNTGLITPDSLDWLDETEHIFTLKLENYRDTSIIFLPDKEEKIYSYIDYLTNVKMLGRIFVKTNVPNSIIFMNDSATGRVTPDTIKNLIPGFYEIRTEAAEHREDSMDVLVQSNITSNAAFFLKDTSVWVDYQTTTSPLPDNYITAIAVDSNNLKWVGLQNSGAATFDGKNWNFYNSSNSPLPGDGISDIEVDVNNNVWIGTTDGAAKFDGVSWTLYTTDTHPVMRSNHVTRIEISADGQIPWIGTTHGLLSYNGTNWYLIDSTKSGLPHRWVTDLRYDDYNNLWIGSNGFGVAKLDPAGEWTRYTKLFIEGSFQVDFPSNFISAIATLGYQVWVGHSPDPGTKIGGLSSYTGSYWITEFNPLPSHVIYRIEIENNNRKWICTSEGLLTFINFGSKILFTDINTPLENNRIRGVAFDKQNRNVWVATYGGGFYKFKRNF